jgi:mannonate dehydratase
VKISDTRTICTVPEGIRLVVVRVETDEPELYGLGCATFTHRPLAVEEELPSFERK